MKTSHLVIASLLLGLILGAAPSLAEFKLWRGGARFDELLDARTLEPPAPGEPAPRVVVDETDHDFGAMQRESSKTHDFTFTNEGEGPLKLQLGDTTCKCTLSELAQDSIPPGESAKVTLEWTAKTSSAEFRQEAAIHTNDPEQDRIVLTVSGKVFDALSILPRDVVFSNAVVDAVAEGTIRVTSYVDEDLDFVEHHLTNLDNAEFFDVKIEPVPPEEFNSADIKRAWQIQVSLKPGLPIGAFTQSLKLVTNSAEFGTVEIPIRGRVTGKVRIMGKGWSRSEQTLSLGTVHQTDGKNAKLIILVSGEYQEDTSFQVAEVTPKQLTARVVDVKSAKNGEATSVSLLVEIPKGSDRGAFMYEKQGEIGQILLESNHSAAKSLRIPVRFAVIE